jgi:hypothetical protein
MAAMDCGPSGQIDSMVSKPCGFWRLNYLIQNIKGCTRFGHLVLAPVSLDNKVK